MRLLLYCCMLAVCGGLRAQPLDDRPLGRFVQAFNAFCKSPPPGPGKDSLPVGLPFGAGGQVLGPAALRSLFDARCLSRMDPSQLSRFVAQLYQRPSAAGLDLCRPGWYAELSCRAAHAQAGEQILFLTFAPAGCRDALRWALCGVRYPYYERLLDGQGRLGLNVTAHELNFAALPQALQPGQSLGMLAGGSAKVDFLGLLLHELRMRRLQLTASGAVRYHCLQVPGWRLVLEQQPGEACRITELWAASEQEKADFATHTLKASYPLMAP